MQAFHTTHRRGGCERMVTLKIFDNEEHNLCYTQYLYATARGDWETSKKLAKTLSEHTDKDPEFQKLLNQLEIK